MVEVKTFGERRNAFPAERAQPCNRMICRAPRPTPGHRHRPGDVILDAVLGPSTLCVMSRATVVPPLPPLDQLLRSWVSCQADSRAQTAALGGHAPRRRCLAANFAPDGPWEHGPVIVCLRHCSSTLGIGFPGLRLIAVGPLAYTQPMVAERALSGAGPPALLHASTVFMGKRL